jgi:hypothetical protein
VAELGPNARAATVLEAAQSGDIVVVTIPLKSIRAVPVEPLVGKIVIDTNNYYPERDGHIPEFDHESTTTSELLQAHLPTAKVVKAFNHIYAAALTTDGQPAGTKNRRALVIAGDDPGAKAVLVQREMECGHSPLVSTARVSAGRGAADRNGNRHEVAGTGTATGFKRRSGWATIVHLVHRTQTSLRSVRAWAGLDGRGSCATRPTG